MSQRGGLRAAKVLATAAIPLALAVICLAAPGLAQDGGETSGFALKTSSGGVAVSNSVKARQIGLPVYPGAKEATGGDRGDLSFSLNRPGEADMKLLVAKLETADSPEQVRDFYRKKLGSRVTRFTEDSSDGSASFEMKADDRHGRYVQIKPVRGKTEIDLVRIEGMDISNRPN